MAGCVTLRADVKASAGSFHIDAALDAPAGETVVLLGPNGAGKTTLLRAVAGLVALDSGRITLDETVLEDTTEGTRLPPDQRPVGFVFQSYLLFPHMSALDNVAFGLRARGNARAGARAEAMEWIERLGLSAQAASKPGALSGGQAQRVALARALVTRPRLLLLDEPLAALDASARTRMRRELSGHLKDFGGVRLVVTHDPLEAVTLADRLIVLEDGKVAQAGPASELRARPRSDYIAGFVGLNLVRGYATRDRVSVGEAELIVPAAPAGEVFVSIHPRSIALYSRRPEGTPRNVFAARIVGIDSLGDRVRVEVVSALPSLVAEVTPGAVAELSLSIGSTVWIAMKATEIDAYPA